MFPDVILEEAFELFALGCEEGKSVFHAHVALAQLVFFGLHVLWSRWLFCCVGLFCCFRLQVGLVSVADIVECLLRQKSEGWQALKLLCLVQTCCRSLSNGRTCSGYYCPWCGDLC